MNKNEKYNSHFLMDVHEVKKYVIDKLKYFTYEEPLEVQEIGDGNINYVFKVQNVETRKSIIIKQADKYLRSSGRELDVYRNKIEAEILMLQGELAPTYVPEVFAYDETMCVLAMEDISAYKNLRTELMDMKQFDHLAINISKFMAATLLPTTDLIMDRFEKKDKVKVYINKELCEISEDLVLSEPYYNFKNRNIILDENKEFVEHNLYKNTKLKTEVSKLRNNFMNNTQALIHGDLHSGSIFINKKGIKIIDPEFAFYGPIGYDIGNVIGNLFFSWTRNVFVKYDADFINWVKQQIIDIYDLTKQELIKKYDEQVTFELYQLKDFKMHYIDNIMSDALGYAGTEIIRRVVGDSKVAELTTIKDKGILVKMERSLINTGIYLIMNRFHITSGSQIVTQGIEV